MKVVLVPVLNREVLLPDPARVRPEQFGVGDTLGQDKRDSGNVSLANPNRALLPRDSTDRHPLVGYDDWTSPEFHHLE